MELVRLLNTPLTVCVCMPRIPDGNGGHAAVQGPKNSLQFVDRNEHVYFWFPLLAGLSELTFDPRCVKVCMCVYVCAACVRTHS